MSFQKSKAVVWSLNGKNETTSFDKKFRKVNCDKILTVWPRGTTMHYTRYITVESTPAIKKQLFRSLMEQV